MNLSSKIFSSLLFQGKSLKKRWEASCFNIITGKYSPQAARDRGMKMDLYTRKENSHVYHLSRRKVKMSSTLHRIQNVCVIWL